MTESSKPAYIGDERLFEVSTEQDEMAFITTLISASFCWDIFGMADGTTNTMSGPGFHALGFNGSEVIGALDVVLHEILDSQSAWLLDIPLKLRRTQTLDARALVTSDGRAAIELPFGAFGGLFGANSVYWQANHGRGTDLGTASDLEDLAAVLMDGKKVQRSGKSRIETHYLDAYHQKDLDKSWDERRRWVWRTTTLQHLFLILHEFGHLALESPETLARPSAGGADLCRREILADKWAIARLARPMPFALRETTAKDREEAVFVLFLSMELLRWRGYLYCAADELAQRYSAATSSLRRGHDTTLPSGEAARSRFFGVG